MAVTSLVWSDKNHRKMCENLQSLCIKGGLAERDGLQTGKEVMELEVNCLYLRFLKLLGK